MTDAATPETTNTPNNWTIVRPGLIRLETTDIYIRPVLTESVATFEVEHRGSVHGASGLLDGAKAHVMHVLDELMQMEVDP